MEGEGLSDRLERMSAPTVCYGVLGILCAWQLANGYDHQTDDVGVFGSPLSNEYALIARHFNIDRSEICELARAAVETIFGGEEEKERLRELMWK